MKRAKQTQRQQQPFSAPQIIVFDEAHRLLGFEGSRAALTRLQAVFRKPNAGLVATQAVMKFKSGKRLRFLGSVRRADGSPLKLAPRKFIPAQVVRRLSV